MSAEDKYSSDTGSGQRDFLSRWSQRKAEAKQKPAANQEQLQTEDPQDLADDVSIQLTAEELDLLSDEQVLDHFDLPDPDALKQGDDFTVFMKSAIPARIRNRALRKLWLSNPALANVDMLVDYGDDFTDAATVVPGMQTAYQVGKGIIRKIEELADSDESEETESVVAEAETHPDMVSDEDIPPNDQDPGVETNLAALPHEEPPTDSANPELELVELDAEELLTPVRPLNRMRFNFDG
ncbi:DUF3306 domain-containing protein [Pararhizobium sp. IMCC21322]|uniref:DUF3306 domain-containing protein n=1 Tax=Pararhizobium sp. IMCC21322 TaxID=3067903 RepID=UPI0027423461|nr:DUF3306 domain-containing protein [Pararhizobium sp. IMCC21322]